MPAPGSTRRVGGLLAAVLLVAVLAGLWWLQGGGSTVAPRPSAPTTQAGSSTTDRTVDPASGLPVVEPGELPPEAAQTLELIEAGGPFPEDRDGLTFENRERLLPRAPPGYYREYTVPTPGSPDRGARRIVTGDRGERYWTADHYASFSVIEPSSASPPG